MTTATDDRPETKPRITDTQLLREAEEIANQAIHATESGDLIDTLDISPSDKALLRSRGYTLRRKLNGADNSGEGSTRDVYYATQKIGNLEREVVVKIPRREQDVTSVNALINRSKRNIDLQEALVGGKLKHPNIVRILESLQLEDGRTFNAEDYIDGWSVRSAVKRTGPMKYLPILRDTFAPLIEAIKYSQGQGIFHRDLTAVNVMIPKEGDGAVLTDWQNAALKRDIDAIAIPTRGGTGSTHPILLNALLTGEPTRASERTEIYSLGTVLYEALTGDTAFDYTLEQNPNGRRIQINGREFRISIRSNGRLLEQVVLEDHEKRLKEAIKKVPRELQKLIYGMLTTNPKKEIDSIYQVDKEFHEATTPTEERFWSKLKKYTKVAGVALAVGFGGMLAGYLGSAIKNAPQRTEVTLNEVLMSSSRTDAFARGDWNLAQSIDLGSRTDFTDYVRQIEKNLDKLEGEKYKEIRRTNRNIRIVDDRLSLALIRSLDLADRSKLKYSEERLESGVPRSYIVNQVSDLHCDKDEKYMNEPFIQNMWMARYVQGMYNPGDSIADVFTKAICSPAEIRQAIAKTQHEYMMTQLRTKGLTGGFGGSLVGIGEVANSATPEGFDYFPKNVKVKERAFRKEFETQRSIPGYRDGLDPVKREVVDRAIVLYLLSDGNGKIDLNRYNSEIQRTSTNYNANASVTNQISIPAKGEAHK